MNNRAARSKRRRRVPADFGVLGAGGGTNGRDDGRDATEAVIGEADEWSVLQAISIPLEYSPPVEKRGVSGVMQDKDVIEP
jgi:hypothetical protein